MENIQCIGGPKHGQFLENSSEWQHGSPEQLVRRRDPESNVTLEPVALKPYIRKQFEINGETKTFYIYSDLDDKDALAIINDLDLDTY